MRAIVLDEHSRILLMHFDNPDHGGRFWITPGGGLEPGEPAAACLRRELEEEVGLTGASIGPPVWTRSHEFRWQGARMRQHETFHLVRTTAFTPRVDGNPASEELAATLDVRWWSVPEIGAAKDVFAPRRLAVLLGRLLDDGPPALPIDVGI